MFSSKDNIVNPTKTITIELTHKIDYVKYVTGEEYSLIRIKEPSTAYIIKDDPVGMIYIGSTPVTLKQEGVGYVLGVKTNPLRYTIYRNEPYLGLSRLLPIESYTDPAKAVKAMELYSRTGTHHIENLKIREFLIKYIDEYISTHTLILGVLSLYGYQDSTNLQRLNDDIRKMDAAFVNAKGTDKDHQHLSSRAIGFFKDMENRMDFYDPMGKYWELYVILESLNFFKDPHYHKETENVDFSNEIRRIEKVFCLPQ